MLTAAWRSLFARKGRLVLSAFAIVLGVAFVSGSLIFTDTLARAFSAVQSGTISDVVVRATGTRSGQGQVSGELISRIRQVPGVATVEGQVLRSGVYVLDKAGHPLGAANVPGYATNFHTAAAAGGLPGLSLLSGRAPAGDGEIAIDPRAAAAGGYHLGDTVTVVTTGDPPVLTKTLVGLVDYGAGGMPGATLATFDTATAQQLFTQGTDQFQQLWVVAARGVTPAVVRDRIDAVLPAGAQAITGDDAAVQDGGAVRGALRFITAFLLVFAAVALLAGSFLVVNTFAMLVTQRSRELALLRALGASRRQLTGSVLLEALVIGVLGSALGLGGGYLLARGIKAVFRRIGFDLSATELVVQGRSLALAAAMGVVVTLAAAYLPARRAGRMAPVAAMADDAGGSERRLWPRAITGAALLAAAVVLLLPVVRNRLPSAAAALAVGFLGVLLAVIVLGPLLVRPLSAAITAGSRRIWGAVATLAGQNAGRNPRRTAVTATSLMVGMALVSMMSVFAASARASVEKVIADNFRGDYVVSTAYGGPFSHVYADRIERVDGVAAVARLRQGAATIHTADGATGPTTLGATDPGPFVSMVAVTAVSGALQRWSDGTVVVSADFAEQHHLRAGDRVTVGFVGRSYPMTVAAVFAHNPAILVDVITTTATFTRMGGGDQDRFVYVDRADGADPAAVRARIQQVLGPAGVISVKDQAQFAQEQRQPIDQLLRVIYALLGLTIVIAVLGIVNTLALSVVERTHEIGLLRAVAMTRPQVRRMIQLEALAISLLGALVGVLVGVLLGWVLQNSQAQQGVTVLVVPWPRLAIAVLLAAVVGVLAAWWPARRAARTDVLAAIATP